jgi:L-ascorbate metabolism protein UlaG (beta-lactamase superfamily)
MRVRRLTWAGIEIHTGEAAVVIDLLGGVPSLAQYAGEPSEPLIAPSAPEGTLTAAAVTHLHSDHFDVEALRRALAPDAPVLCPAPVAETVAEAGLNARGVELWETVAVGDIELTAVPAVDGFGSDQVSWIAADGEQRLIHCGDTLWHGYWWQIAERGGPFDVAFLPINAAVTEFDYLQPPSSGMPAVLTPEQAAAAADVLGVRVAVPIHYGTFHKPPTYIAYPGAEAAFLGACLRRGVSTRIPRAGDEVGLAPVTAQ